MDDMRDIEQFFLKKEKEEIEKEEQEIEKTTGKKIKNSPLNDRKVRKLENEVKELLKRNSELELKLDSLSTEKYNGLNQRDTNEIADMFMDFSIDKHHDKKAKNQINNLTDENKQLRSENKRLLKLKEKFEEEKKQKSFKKRSYDEIFKKIKLTYKRLLPESVMALATAEYLYLNETSGQLDYSGTYVNYVKALELELKRVYKLSSKKDTFGGLMKRLKENSDFKTFVNRIEQEKVIHIRNKAIHKGNVTKNECGKVRKLLLQDNWLDRILFLVEQSRKSQTEREISFKVYVKQKIGTLHYKGVTYNRYSTNREIDILSPKTNLSGFISGIGKEIFYKEESYIIYVR